MVTLNRIIRIMLTSRQPKCIYQVNIISKIHLTMNLYTYNVKRTSNDIILTQYVILVKRIALSNHRIVFAEQKYHYHILTKFHARYHLSIRVTSPILFKITHPFEKTCEILKEFILIRSVLSILRKNKMGSTNTYLYEKIDKTNEMCLDNIQSSEIPWSLPSLCK